MINTTTTIQQRSKKNKTTSRKLYSRIKKALTLDELKRKYLINTTSSNLTL